jgi:hypothetical protein
MKVKYWTLMLVLLQLLVLAIILATLSTPHWVQQRDNYASWEGGLLVCYNCPDKYDGDSYTRLADDSDICNDSNLDGACKTFEDLRDAGACYVSFTVISILCLIVWLVRTCLLWTERRLPLMFAVIWPILTFSIHLLAFILWAGISRAKFEDVDNCDKISLKDKEDICAGDGPGLALFNVFLMLGVGGVDVAMYRMMSEARPK